MYKAVATEDLFKVVQVSDLTRVFGRAGKKIKMHTSFWEVSIEGVGFGALLVVR